MGRLHLEDVRFTIGAFTLGALKEHPTIYKSSRDGALDLYIGEYDFTTCGNCADDHLTYYSSYVDIHETLYNNLPAWLYSGCLFDEDAPIWRLV